LRKDIVISGYRTMTQLGERKKEQLNVSVSPWIKKKLKELAETKDFASVSDVVNLAIMDFIVRHEQSAELKKRTAVALS